MTATSMCCITTPMREDNASRQNATHDAIAIGGRSGIRKHRPTRAAKTRSGFDEIDRLVSFFFRKRLLVSSCSRIGISAAYIRIISVNSIRFRRPGRFAAIGIDQQQTNSKPLKTRLASPRSVALSALPAAAHTGRVMVIPAAAARCRSIMSAIR